MSSYTANALNQYSQRTVPGYAGVRGSATNTATVTVNGNAAWRLDDYFYGGDDADNAASAVMKELDITAVVNPPGTNTPDLVESITGRVYVAQSPEAFTRDEDGNLLNDGRFNYTWDGENRLICAEEQVCLTNRTLRKVDCGYDHQGRMVWKAVSHRATEAQRWDAAESHSFLYDGWNMIREIQHSNIPAFHSSTNSYVWGLDLSGSLQGAGGVGGLLAVVQEGDAHCSACDANGNVVEYVSADGGIAAHYEYDAFGRTIAQFGDLADSFLLQFSTKYWEDEAKLYYYGYRFYMPNVGRWLNRDPIEEQGGINVYNYVFNCILVFWDTNGRAPQLIGVTDDGGAVYTPDIDWGDNPLGGGRSVYDDWYEPYVPDTSDGLSFTEAWLAYYFGGGRDLTVPFSVIDPGWGVSDFKDFQPCSYSTGTHEIKPAYRDRELFTWSTLSIAGPGRVVFTLNGSISMEANGKWEFSGNVSAGADRFNFDPRDRFGERDGTPSWWQYALETANNPLSFMCRYRFITYPRESITRWVHDWDTVLRGQEFFVIIQGKREVKATGCCEK